VHPSRAFHVGTPAQALSYAEAFPFAVLTAWDGARLRTVQAPLIPVVDGTGALIAFEGHVAHANAFTQALVKKAQPVPGLAVFCGPDAYVPAGAYPSKAVHGQAVPTWNYITVEAEGVLALTTPSDTRAILERQAQVFEATQPQPWTLSEADPAYLERLEQAIIGLRLEVHRFEATHKLSQNKADLDDFDGVVSVLEARGEADAADLAARMKTLERG